MSDRYDVVGIGNAIVDVISHGDDSFLENMGITKGIMQLVERERAELLYAAMSDRVQTAGGSVANTIAGVGSLGLSTAFLGKVKDDALGRFYAGHGRAGDRFSQPARRGRPAAHLAVDDLRLARWGTVDEHLSGRRRGFRRG
jgi:sugar/nucleoside kinase (ribokinase family)